MRDVWMLFFTVMVVGGYIISSEITRRQPNRKVKKTKLHKTKLGLEDSPKKNKRLK